MDAGDWLILIIVLAATGACVRHGYDPEVIAKEAAEKQEKRLNELTPRYVTTVDGCNVYKFIDGEATKYVTVCPNGHTNTQFSHQILVGKVHKTIEESIEVKP